MLDALRPVLSLTIVIPALFLAYVPVQSYLRQPVARLLRWLLPLMLALTIGGGLLCLSAASAYRTGAGADYARGVGDLYPDAAYLPVEVRNDCPIGLRGIRLPGQPGPRV